MKGINRVILVGSVGRDPELRRTRSGSAVANLSLATNSSWKGSDGNWQEKTEWHKIVVFGKLAGTVEQYVSKGRQLYIEGRLQTREWEDKQGNKRQTTEVVANEVVFLGGKNDRQGQDVAEAIFSGAEVPREFEGPQGGDF